MKKKNKKQFDCLVNCLQKNEDLARGYFKCGTDVNASIKARWTEIANKLNSLGPPRRNIDGWMKVWADLKFQVRKKKAHNKAEINATGGGRNKLPSFTAIEEAVVDILNLDNLVDPSGKEFGISSTQIERCEQVTPLSCLSNINTETSQAIEIPTTSYSSNTTYMENWEEDIQMTEYVLDENPPIIEVENIPGKDVSAKKRKPTQGEGTKRGKNCGTESQRIKLLEK